MARGTADRGLFPGLLPEYVHRMYMPQTPGTCFRRRAQTAVAALQCVQALHMHMHTRRVLLLQHPALMRPNHFLLMIVPLHMTSCFPVHRAQRSSIRPRPSWRRCSGCPMACAPSQRLLLGALCRRSALAPGRPAAGAGGRSGEHRPGGSPPATCAARRRRLMTTTCCSAMAAASMCAPACLTWDGAYALSSLWRPPCIGMLGCFVC